MTHAEMTKALRTMIKEAGISARVRKMVLCGNQVIQVYTTSHETYFSAAEIRTINTLARDNGMTFVQNIAIDVNHAAQLTGRQVWDFYL